MCGVSTYLLSLQDWEFCMRCTDWVNVISTQLKSWELSVQIASPVDNISPMLPKCDAGGSQCVFYNITERGIIGTCSVFFL